ncbi:MAG: xanthine dehydrogenase molybdopterin binding subunit [Planctomycetota bacterium]
MSAVGRDIQHDSARTHVTGESVFLDDRAPLSGELLAGVVPSPCAHGRVVRVDVAAALQVPGVHAVMTAGDIRGHNRFGPVVHDEDLIAEEVAVFLGQPVALIAAESDTALRAGVAAVAVEMEELAPILDIDAAIEAGSFLGEERTIACGDLEAGFAAADGVVEGAVEIGGQEQFYLESQVAIAIPGESGQMQVLSSTQHPSEVQALVAEALGVPFHLVTCECKRMGGAFGGKETQAAPPAMMAALLAKRTGRAVRFRYGKDDDMRFTGKRHPFKSFYRAGYTRDGVLTALDVRLYSNGGCSTDLSAAVLERAMLHSDNTSFIPNVRVRARICKTNLPSNTAFRGFGGPQGVASTEHVLHEVAVATGLDPLDVRRANCYGVGERNVTPYGQIVTHNTLPELFDTLRDESGYDARRAEVDAFNGESRTQLRGLAISGVKFGISFTRRTLNQANALVNIYLDGSVMVSTGATEMGQGVNTRVRQVVADGLGVDYDRVIVAVTSTDKNNNTSPTAASSGTDLNGAAALEACNQLRARLAGVAAEMLAEPDTGLAAEPEAMVFADGVVRDQRRPGREVRFEEVVTNAYEQRVSLGERGFYATPGIEFNRATGKGVPFRYFTTGAACSEVLIDRFTGEMVVTRLDLIMDLGRPINPGIDRGQVIGGYVQGMGWCTTEELVYGDDGRLLSYSPTTYKIPAITDLPPICNVRFLDAPDHPISLHGSKAVGEPPLLLGLSAWLAAKDALRYVLPGNERKLALPATGEAILLAMESAPRGVAGRTQE